MGLLTYLQDEDEVEDLKAELSKAKADLEDRERDVRDLKKRLREVPVNSGVLDVGKSVSSKNDAGKEEVTGLK
jgi:predicted  nucleic acid-binding Zn-ribbon protein